MREEEHEAKWEDVREKTWEKELLKSQDEKDMLQNAQQKGLGDWTGR